VFERISLSHNARADRALLSMDDSRQPLVVARVAHGAVVNGRDAPDDRRDTGVSQSGHGCAAIRAGVAAPGAGYDREADLRQLAGGEGVAYS